MKPFKVCTLCAQPLTRADWDALPPAGGGLLAYDCEWRNHSCGQTMAVPLSQLTPRTVRPGAEMGVSQ